ncbi:MAG: oligoendopeptidase F family protein, partial [Lentisphaeria bacterium]|nr:oligoendopeptidase F family protein [Lentisphaeria bacterium]
TNGNYAHFLENPDRAVRKAAYDSCYDTYKSLINTYASILDGTVKTDVLEAKLRNHASAREMALSGDNIPLAVYDNLVDTVHEYLPALHRYFKLRADVMGMEKITMYDIMNPLVPESVQVIPWEEAERLVKRALQPLGETYCNILGHAFTDRWIDIRECRGKRSGAYSWGCYRLPPYLLLNHSDDLESVFTLAHELGHSMHSYFSDRAQDYHYAGYRIFAAEVASTTNELLLYHDLMAHATDDAERASLLTYLLGMIRGTAFRQTMFAEFERDIYAWSENGEPLTAEALCDHYFELNRLYHGPAVEPDEKIRYEWARIPHFHYGFYVYKYATGISAAAALAKDILSGKTDRYMGFLKSGDSKDVIDILKDAGVDFTSPAPVAACMQLFDETVTGLEKLLLKKN